MAVNAATLIITSIIKVGASFGLSSVSRSIRQITNKISLDNALNAFKDPFMVMMLLAVTQILPKRERSERHESWIEEFYCEFVPIKKRKCLLPNKLQSKYTN